MRKTGRKLLNFDRRLGVRFVAGADEAGRGSLAGPLVTAAVLFDYVSLRDHRVRPLARLNDSKQLSPDERARLFHAVAGCATRIAVRIIPPAVIDSDGLHRSNLRGLRETLADLSPPAEVCLVDGFRLCGTVPAAAGRTYILSGPEVTTLNDLVAITADVAGVTPLPLHLPVWPFWLAGAACEALCRPFGIEPPIYRRRVDFFTKSRAFDSSRARTEIGYAPRVALREGIGRMLAWYREAGWL